MARQKKPSIPSVLYRVFIDKERSRKTVLVSYRMSWRTMSTRKQAGRGPGGSCLLLDPGWQLPSARSQVVMVYCRTPCGSSPAGPRVAVVNYRTPGGSMKNDVQKISLNSLKRPDWAKAIEFVKLMRE
ncbi:unnamed protein product, partial [Nesidiocoris tenuis]